MKQHIDNYGACWNIIPKLFTHQDNIDKLVYVGIGSLIKEGFLNKGDKVVIAGGAKAVADLTNDEVKINNAMGGIIEI